MADFARFAALAERLIGENGRDVTLVLKEAVQHNVGKTWRGTGDYPRKTVTGKAVFLPAGSSGMFPMGKAHRVGSDERKLADQVAIFAANDDQGQALEFFDMMIDSGVEWQIVEAHVLQPSELRIIYVFEVKR